MTVDDSPISDSTLPTLVEVRVTVPIIIGGEVFKVGDTTSLSRRDAEALRASGRVVII